MGRPKQYASRAEQVVALRAKLSPPRETPRETLSPRETPAEPRETPHPYDPWGSNVWPGLDPERTRLRGQLDLLRDDYGRCQAAQDWAGCQAVNGQREPIFLSLWNRERALPDSERYWFPARVLSDGQARPAKR